MVLCRSPDEYLWRQGVMLNYCQPTSFERSRYTACLCGTESGCAIKDGLLKTFCAALNNRLKPGLQQGEISCYQCRRLVHCFAIMIRVSPGCLAWLRSFVSASDVIRISLACSHPSAD